MGVKISGLVTKEEAEKLPKVSDAKKVGSYTRHVEEQPRSTWDKVLEYRTIQTSAASQQYMTVESFASYEEAVDGARKAFGKELCNVEVLALVEDKGKLNLLDCSNLLK